nr:hypothetical protein [Desulfobulbaceae bacterium]
MVRVGITVLLFIAVFAMMRGISETWRGQLPSLPARDGKKVEKVAGPPAKLNLQPTAPIVMPDLKPGYLFNEERLIESEADKLAEEGEDHGNDLGISADVAQLTYSGSIIGDTFSQALVSFPPGKDAPKTQQSGSRRQRVSKSSAEETARLKVGDVLSGYLVAEISPEKLVLKKGDEVLEKFMYDPDKKRVAPTRQPRAAATPERPAPASTNAPAPLRATTGGAAAVTAPQEGAAATPQPVTRRMVISRKPPPRPDTSRVSRRGRSSTPEISTPPMPTSSR